MRVSVTKVGSGPAARRWLPVCGDVAVSGPPGERTALGCQRKLLAARTWASLSLCGSGHAATQVRAVALNRSWHNLMARALARLIVFARCEMHGAQARIAVIKPFFWVSDHLGRQPYGYPVSGARPPRRYLTHGLSLEARTVNWDGERILPPDLALIMGEWGGRHR